MIITTSLVTQPSLPFSSQPEVSILPSYEIPLSTEVSLRYPVNQVKINQGFRFFHPGVDLGGHTEDPVYPIAKGVVVVREFSRFGYGNSIVIDHGNGLKSRYAHLSRIDVHDTDFVDPRYPIGLLGSTGRSTGPHLHLEIYQDGNRINPLAYLSTVNAR